MMSSPPSDWIQLSPTSFPAYQDAGPVLGVCTIAQNDSKILLGIPLHGGVKIVKCRFVGCRLLGLAGGTFIEILEYEHTVFLHTVSVIRVYKLSIKLE